METKDIKVRSKRTYIAPKKVKSRRNRAKPRTLTTYNNKLRKLKSIYTKLYNNSKKHSNNNSKHFFEKYPTFESYLANYKLKQPGKEREATVSRSTVRKGIWGM